MIHINKCAHEYQWFRHNVHMHACKWSFNDWFPYLKMSMNPPSGNELHDLSCHDSVTFSDEM